MEEIEVWREAPGFPLYEVSSLGRVKGLKSGKILQQRVNNMGTVQNILYNGKGKGKNISTARVICRAFHGEPEEAELVAFHLNGDPQDNRADNLAWKKRLSWF